MASLAPKLQRLGRYEIIRHLASGGMAEIYLADGVGEKVVVKVISAERAQDQKFIQMFLDEARVASTLHHPNIASMIEVGRDGETYFFAMEYVEGETVRAVLERAVGAGARIPLAVCLRVIASVAAGLHHAHERKGGTGTQLQIVHRDVTPSNIMMGLDGSVKLLDFGIAQAEGRAAETQSGTIKGKFAYMSPEQCRGKAVDRRTDVFALGIVMYELTTQRRAFRTDNDFDTMDRIVRGRFAKPSMLDPTYPRDLERIVLRAMAIEPADRYQTAAELGRALEELAAQQGTVATAEDVAVCLRDLFGGGPIAVRSTSEGTVSDVEMQISPGVLDDSADAADAAATHRRLVIPLTAPLDDGVGAETVDVAAAPPPPLSRPVSQNRRPVSASMPALPLAQAPQGTGSRTIIGAPIGSRPPSGVTGANPVVTPGLLDSGRRPLSPPLPTTLPTAATFVSPGTGTSASHLHERHRTGLVIAIVAIVLVMLAIAAVLLSA